MKTIHAHGMDIVVNDEGLPFTKEAAERLRTAIGYATGKGKQISRSDLAEKVLSDADDRGFQVARGTYDQYELHPRKLIDSNGAKVAESLKRMLALFDSYKIDRWTGEKLNGNGNGNGNGGNSQHNTGTISQSAPAAAAVQAVENAKPQRPFAEGALEAAEAVAAELAEAEAVPGAEALVGMWLQGVNPATRAEVVRRNWQKYLNESIMNVPGFLDRLVSIIPEETIRRNAAEFVTVNYGVDNGYLTVASNAVNQDPDPENVLDSARLQATKLARRMRRQQQEYELALQQWEAAQAATTAAAAASVDTTPAAAPAQTEPAQA